MGLTIVTLAVPHGWRWVSGCAPPGSGFAPRTLGSAAASAVQTAGPCRYPGHRPCCPLLWAASSRPSSHSLPPLPPAAPRSPRGPEWQPLPSHQHQQEEYSRLDEAGQVTLLWTAARSAQRVVASRDHARHAAGERTEPATAMALHLHDPQTDSSQLAPPSCPLLSQVLS